MAFPASQQLLVQALSKASELALRIKGHAQRVRDDSASGPIPRVNVVALMGALTKSIDAWNSISQLSGIQQYARDQYDDQNLNIGAEFTAMRSAAIVLRDWIFDNYPKAASGAWESLSHTNDGAGVALTFTSAQLSQFRTEADAFLATIS